MAFQLFLVDNKVESQVRVQDEIRAKRIIVVNDKGQKFVEIGTYEEGGAVSVFNKAGTIVYIFTDKIGGGISVVNKAGHIITAMGYGAGEKGFVSIGNNIGKPVVSMLDTEEGHGGIVFADRNGKSLGSLP